MRKPFAATPRMGSALWHPFVFGALYLSAYGCAEDKADGTPTKTPAATTQKVSGGNPAPEGAYPFLGSLQEEWDGQWGHVCGASLVSPRFALTADHCLAFSADDEAPIRAVFNANDPLDPQSERKIAAVKRVIYFPGNERCAGWECIDACYDECFDCEGAGCESACEPCAEGCAAKYACLPDASTFDEYYEHLEAQLDYEIGADVALLELEQPLDIEPVRLGRSPHISDGEMARVAGWGDTIDAEGNDVDGPRRYAVATLPMFSAEACRDMGIDVGEYNFCAGEVGLGACTRDSGGPLFVQEQGQFVQLGVVSSGQDYTTCNVRKGGGIYVAVPQIASWVEQHVGDLPVLVEPEPAADWRVVPSEQCPEGYRHVALEAVASRQPETCALLDYWGIVRLADGASADGKGYDCRTREKDTRRLGHSLCEPASATPANGTWVSPL